MQCKSKDAVLNFFIGAGVPSKFTSDISDALKLDRKAHNKFEIVRIILGRLNGAGDGYLTTRREIIKRVIDFEDFTRCWPDDQLKAKGSVAQVREVIGVHDAFTRMSQEREREAQAAREERQRAAAKVAERRAKIDAVKTELWGLFALTNPQARGKRLEAVLNSLFAAYGILLREAFSLKGNGGEGVVEQIDGVIDVDGIPYLVEMKWLASNIGVPEVSQHLVRLFSREGARGLFIGYPGFSDAAITTCRDALGKLVITLATLEEIVNLLDHNGDLVEFLRTKTQLAMIERRPFVDLSRRAHLP